MINKKASKNITKTEVLQEKNVLAEHVHYEILLNVVPAPSLMEKIDHLSDIGVNNTFSGGILFIK